MTTIGKIPAAAMIWLPSPEIAAYSIASQFGKIMTIYSFWVLLKSVAPTSKAYSINLINGMVTIGKISAAAMIWLPSPEIAA